MNSHWWCAKCEEPVEWIEEQPKRVCEWTHDADMDAWETACDNAWQFTEGTPADNKAKFCPYCGGEIKEVSGE